MKHRRTEHCRKSVLYVVASEKEAHGQRCDLFKKKELDEEDEAQKELETPLAADEESRDRARPSALVARHQPTRHAEGTGRPAHAHTRTPRARAFVPSH